MMMCDCDRWVGERFLSHQLDKGCVLETQQRVPVTLGFVEGICRECRGLKPEPHPKAELHGATSKIKRYYWRELAFLTYKMIAERAEMEGLDPQGLYTQPAQALTKQVERDALNEIKRLHKESPKYDFSEPSQQEVIGTYGVEVQRLDAVYAPSSSEKGAGILSGEEVVSAEEFVGRHFKEKEWSVIFCESRPFHVIFGVFMWPVIQDSDDPLCETRGFASKAAYPSHSLAAGQQIWMLQPRDFGTPGYGLRRAEVIDQHLESITPPSQSEFLHLFDYWLEDSVLLRDYLWAHDAGDISTARNVLEVLSPQVILRILRYLVGDYWRRYTGWPDLLVFREEEFFLVEVKASKDKLSGDQKRWIADNSSILELPFKLVKIHRSATAGR